MTDDSYVELFPYIKTREVFSEMDHWQGKTLRLIDNPFMFREVKITTK
jgi:hypothetical protein